VTRSQPGIVVRRSRNVTAHLPGCRWLLPFFDRCLTHCEIGTVRMCTAFPNKSAITQRSSRNPVALTSGEAACYLVALRDLLVDREFQIGESNLHDAQNIFKPPGPGLDLVAEPARPRPPIRTVQPSPSDPE